MTEAKTLPGYKLFLRFQDGVSGEVDLSSFVGRGVFASWLQPGNFEQVRITEVGALEWPSEIDLCPDSLYLRLTGKAPEELFSNITPSRLAHA